MRRSTRLAGAGMGLSLMLTAMGCTNATPGHGSSADASRTAGSTAGAASSVPAINPTSRRDTYHFTVPDHWKNDPQRPIWFDGAFHYYYLYNADYPREVGTAWRHATTKDNVTFTDQGVAIPKKTNANFDVWSGSVVEDTTGSAGFGKGAIVALVTQMDHPTPQQIVDASGPQAQFLWYSVDRGKTFKPYGERPVMPNPGVRDFRDPKVIRDEARQQWVTVLAEGNKVGFYTSPDLKSWTYVSGYVRDDLGTLECPDLFTIRTASGQTKWVLGVSGNQTPSGGPNTYAYWVGSFDGRAFTPDDPTVQWLDHGNDWYGAVTYADPTSDQRRFAIGWMNNWAYANQPAPTWTSDGFTGTDSIVRELRLVDEGGRMSLRSAPVSTLRQRASRTIDLGTVPVDGTRVMPYHGESYVLDADLTWSQHTPETNVGIQVRRSADGSRHGDIGVYGDYAYVNRAHAGNPGRFAETKSPFDLSRGSVHVTVLVDRSTIEVFFDDGRSVHSNLAFAEPGDDGLAFYGVGGGGELRNVRITEITPIG